MEEWREGGGEGREGYEGEGSKTCIVGQRMHAISAKLQMRFSSET